MQPTSVEMLSLDVRMRDRSLCILLGKAVYDSVNLIDFAVGIVFALKIKDEIVMLQSGEWF